MQLKFMDEYKVKIVLLPGLAQASRPDDPATMFQLSRMLRLMDLISLPSFEEYQGNTFSEIIELLFNRSTLTYRISTSSRSSLRLPSEEECQSCLTLSSSQLILQMTCRFVRPGGV
jgi:hypothetical protein